MWRDVTPYHPAPAAWRFQAIGCSRRMVEMTVEDVGCGNPERELPAFSARADAKVTAYPSTAWRQVIRYPQRRGLEGQPRSKEPARYGTRAPRHKGLSLQPGSERTPIALRQSEVIKVTVFIRASDTKQYLITHDPQPI